MTKKIIVSTLSCLMGTAAMAQSSVQLYGIAEASVENVTNVGADGKSLSRMPNSAVAPSRIGFRGTEDLGGGLKAVFTFEQGLNLNNGSLGQGGRGFGRQAYVGLSGPFGTITAGRLYTMTFWSGTRADIHGGGLYGTGSLDSYIPNARADSAIGWMKKFGNLDLGATYSFGRDAVNAGPSPAGTNCSQQSGDSKACREWSVMASYNTADWGVAVANDRIHGRALTGGTDAVFGGLDSSDKTDNRAIVTGWFKLGDTRIGGGLVQRKNEGAGSRPDSKLWHIGAATPVAKSLTLSGQVVALRYDDNSDYNATLAAVRLSYELSKRTTLFGQVGHIRNGDLSTISVNGGTPGSNPAAGVSQTGINLGIRHNF